VSTASTTQDETTDACSPTVSDAQQLTDAILRANDEAQCEGPNTITLSSSIQLSATYDGGDTAFPPITSVLTIQGQAGAESITISRDANAPEFRFFFVEGRNGNNGQLTLAGLTLSSGSALDG